MTALVVLGLLGVTALFLAGALTYLYRWRVRKRLFPQLPRLWKGDRSRFLVSTVLFVVSLMAFMVASLVTGPSLPEPPQKQLAKKEQGPSFDGAPPPPMPPPAKPEAPPEPKAEPPAAPYTTPAAALNNELPAKAQPKEMAQAPAPQQRPPEQAGTQSAPADAQPPKVQAAQEPAPKKESPPAPAAAPKAEPKPPEPAPGKAAKAPAPGPAAPAPEPAPAKEKAPPAKTEPPKAKAAAPAAPPAKTKKTAKAASAGKPKEKTPAKAASNIYTVCAASFKDRESAQRQVERLNKKGLKGKIVKADLKGKGVWYRVCLGEFATPGQAAAKSKAWRDNDLVKTPFVVRLR